MFFRYSKTRPFYSLSDTYGDNWSEISFASSVVIPHCQGNSVINRVAATIRLVFALFVPVFPYFVSMLGKSGNNRLRREERGAATGDKRRVDDMTLWLQEVRSQLRGDYDVSDDEDPFDPDMPLDATRNVKRPKEDVPTPPQMVGPRVIVESEGTSTVSKAVPGPDLNEPPGRDSSSSVEGVDAAGETPFFTGDVGRMANRILELAADEAAEDRAECDRLKLWVMYSGAGMAPPSYVNRRTPTRWEEEGSRLAPSEGGVQPNQQEQKKSRTYTRSVGEEGASGKERKHTRPSRTLGMRAAAMADRVKNDPMRILGVLGTGRTNRKWVIQISRAIMGRGISEGTLRNWAARAPE